MDSTHNDQFKVAEFKTDALTMTVYMVNPGEAFHGFGGSRHALPVKKTASMIVRTLGPMGLNDCEYDINDKSTWLALMNVARATPAPKPRVITHDAYRDMLTDLGIDPDEPEEVIDPTDYYELYQTGSFSFYLGQHEKRRYFTMRLVIEEREKGE